MTRSIPSSDRGQVTGARGDVADVSKDISDKLHFGRGHRLPMIRQTEATECGLACLAMIANYYGHREDIASLRRRFSLSLKGATLERLIDMAGSLGLTGRPLRLEMEELAKLQVPCILHWNLNHFVILKKVSKRGVVVHDPAVGERTLDWKEASKHFTGVALELNRGPTFRRQQAPPPVALRALAGSIKGLGHALGTIFALALALELFALLSPQFLQMVVDQVLADGDHDLLTMLGVSFLLLMVVQTTVSALRTWTVVWLGTHFSMNWTGNVFQHLLKLPQVYFLKRHLGDIVSRFGAIDTIQHTLTTQFVGVILDGLMATVTLSVMLIYSPLLAGITVSALFLYAAIRLLYFRVYRESNLSLIVVSAKQQSRFMEAMRGVQTIRLYNQGPAQTVRYLNATADTLNTSIAVQRLNLWFGSFNEITVGSQRVIVLWAGAWLALKGQFSAGMLMAFVAYADQFTGRAASLIDYSIQLRMLRLQGERLADIVLTAPEPFADGIYVGPRPEPSIRFENVSFRYAEGEAWVIKNCSFEINAKESVAIVGPSGCGKSTLVRLMLGLLDPQEGKILVGGVDLKHLGKKTYREMLSSVMQDDRLFAGSIADNISFFDDAATQERVAEAAKLAQLHDDIVAMPMGYHSLTGDMGSCLSGGQQQRLLLARALYRVPSILVLDEATSHLDVPREQAIALQLSMMGLTQVVIAHRKETIAMVDRVLRLERGGIEQEFTHLDVPTDAGDVPTGTHA
jgi:ATP-binding cassette subfamily B protein RaxB